MYQKRKEFTLIELLIVISIIGILASLLLPALFNSRIQAQNAKAKTTIQSLVTALKSYHSDWGTLPPHTPGSFDSSTLLLYLDGDSSNGGPKTAYFEFKQDEIEGGLFLDPFGRSYHYRQPRDPGGAVEPSTVNKKNFDVWSEGEIGVVDGDVDGKDDSRNW